MNKIGYKNQSTKFKILEKKQNKGNNKEKIKIKRSKAETNKRKS